MKKITPLTFLFFVFLSSSAVAVEVDKNIDIQARHIAEQLRCPVCRGVPIAESPSGLAQDMMSVIRQKLKEGETPDQILTYFTEHYGEWILLKPKPHGLNLMIWILPILILVGGGGLLTFAISKWSKKA